MKINKFKIILASLILLDTIQLNAQSIAWANQFESTEAKGLSIKTDASGNIYTVGYFKETADFDPGSGVTTLTTNSSVYNAFISKLDANGNFAWAKQLGGNSSSKCYANSLILDALGNIYITGYFKGAVDFDPGPGIITLTTTSNVTSAFVCKLDATGDFLWAKQLGGNSSSNCYGNSIALDGSNNVYTTGYFKGTVDFDPGAGIKNLISSTSSNSAFICKLDGNGNSVWAKQFGNSSSGSWSCSGISIIIDGNGNAYTTGTFKSTVDFDPGPGTFNMSSSSSYYSTFISKLDPSGNYVWAKRLGGSALNSSCDVTSITLDNANNIYTIGSCTGGPIDFDPGVGTDNIIPFYDPNCSCYTVCTFISKLDANGNYIWAKKIDGNTSSLCYGQSIVLDGSNNIYATGNFQDTVDFDPGVGFAYLSSVGDDMFVSKLDANGNSVWTKQMGGTSARCHGSSIALDGLGNAYITGDFIGNINFNPADGGTVNLGGFDDAFVLRLNLTLTNIKEQKQNNFFNIYPNPNNGNFTIQLNNTFNNTELELSIINSNGTEVFKSSINNNASLYNVHGLEKGIYYAILSKNKIVVSTSKLIIE